MPTYEYRCKACGHELEAVQAFTDDPLTECPECGGDLRKKFGTVGITFKGSGFYKTDSRSSASPSSKDSSKDSSSKDSSSGDGGSSTTSTEGSGGSKAGTSGDGGPSKAGASASASTASTT
jgi:putative FmdB family regulatory protein